MSHLTAIILTHNESEHISACLASLSFADHRLVFDSFSTDDTVALARAAGAEVVQHDFVNFANQRNAALEHIQRTGQSAWVLFVDADERIPPELVTEIRHSLATASETIAGYRIPRHNHIFGKLTRGAGWYPDYQTRLLRVGKAHYDPLRQVHEVVVLDGELGTLREHIVHYNYKDARQFAAKQRYYSAYEAKILYEQGIHPKPWTYLTQPLRHIYWRFITLKGYRDGWHGLRLSLLMGWYEARKYCLLRGLRRKIGRETSPPHG